VEIFPLNYRDEGDCGDEEEIQEKKPAWELKRSFLRKKKKGKKRCPVGGIRALGDGGGCEFAGEKFDVLRCGKTIFP